MIRDSLVNELTTESFVLEEDKNRAPYKETLEYNYEIDNKVIGKKGIIKNTYSIGTICTKSTEHDSNPFYSISSSPPLENNFSKQIIHNSHNQLS